MDKVKIFSLEDAVKHRILVLDGAMGTKIQQFGLTESDFHGYMFRHMNVLMAGNNDVLNLTRPDIIGKIHEEYLKAGADIITTNTFSSQRVSQADYKLDNFARQMAYEGAKLAKNTALKFSTPNKPRWVAGSIGPTNKSCSMSPDVSDPAARSITYDDLLCAYIEQIDALIEGGVDILLIETIFDTLNAKAAINAAVTSMEKHLVKLPIMLSVTASDLAGRTLSGQTLLAFLASISSFPIFSVGLNCSFGAKQMKPLLKDLAANSPYYVSAYPNAGLPNSIGLYDETAETMTPLMEDIMQEGLVNIIGGCCGTDEHFIKKFVDAAVGKKPHKPKADCNFMQLSGLDHLWVTPQLGFVNVGERCNVAGSRKFLRLINEKKYDEAVAIARKQVSDGALVIDINMDDGLLNAKKEMTNFLNIIAAEPDVAKVPVMIDSSDWDVISTALTCVQGKCIVNSISLKEGEESFLKRASVIKRHGAAVVVMCFDENGQATSFERRIEIAQRACNLLISKAGFKPYDIIIDPNVLAIATGMEEHDSYAADFIKACEWIKKNLPGVHISGGVSNLSFAFRGNNEVREAMHAVFLYHAIKKGMDFGIVNPAAKITYNDIPADQLKIYEDAILYKSEHSAADLIELASKIKQVADAKKASGSNTSKDSPLEEWRNSDIEHRLIYALRRGIGDYLQQDIEEALVHWPKAVDIIEGPLMSGMGLVGQLFGEGKMFLPQVVKAARTMKMAVGMLQPHIEAQRNGQTTKVGKVLLATVKGDVHDIGKNIVSVVMACNNFEVVDMGVMVPAEQIVKKAIEEKVDLIGLSGLITPSLEEMVNVAKQLKEAGLDIPIMIGGATTSQLHVALKIAPVYAGPIVWMKDASQNSIIASKLINNKERGAFQQQLEKDYKRIRDDYDTSQKQMYSIEEARQHKLNLFDK